MEGGDAMRPSKVFILYYILLFNDMVFQSHISAKDDSKPTAQKGLDRLPMNKILLHIEQKENREYYRTIYPDLISLISAQYPEFLHVSSFLHWESYRDELRYRIWMDTRRAVVQPVTDRDVVETLTESLKDDAVLSQYLEFLCSLPHVEIFKYFDTVTLILFPAVVQRRYSEEVLNLVVKIFYILNILSPRELWLRVINAWHQPDLDTRGSYSHHELVLDPLLLFRCIYRVFQVPQLFQLFLHVCPNFYAAYLRFRLKILDCYMMSSKNYTLRIFKETHLNALVDLQETSIIQTLLEVCWRIHNNEEKETGSDIVRYEMGLIPIAVAEIHSMHVCFEFIPELLAQPQYEKQVFGIFLSAHLFEKYPLPASLALARDIVLPRIHGILRSVIPAKTKRELVVEGLTKIARGFPSLASSILGIIEDAGRLEQCDAIGVQKAKAIVASYMNDPKILNKSVQ
ncbi:integrator complex subunit 2 [Chytridium lagenaria]|nr:integrator complex subunit 2 [Chytridium lagenaria]